MPILIQLNGLNNITTFSLLAWTLSPQTILLCQISPPPAFLEEMWLEPPVHSRGFTTSRIVVLHQMNEWRRRESDFHLFHCSPVKHELPQICTHPSGLNEFSQSFPLPSSPPSLWSQHLQVRCWHAGRLLLVCVVMCEPRSLLTSHLLPPSSSPPALQDYSTSKTTVPTAAADTDSQLTLETLSII